MLLTEHPDITGRREPPEVDALRGHPLDRQLALGRLVVGVVLDPSVRGNLVRLGPLCSTIFLLPNIQSAHGHLLSITSERYKLVIRVLCNRQITTKYKHDTFYK